MSACAQDLDTIQSPGELVLFDLTESAGGPQQLTGAALAQGAQLTLEVRNTTGADERIERIEWSDESIVRTLSVSERRIQIEGLVVGEATLEVHCESGLSLQETLRIEPVAAIRVRPAPFQRSFPEPFALAEMSSILMVPNTRFHFLLEYRDDEGRDLAGYVPGWRLLGASATSLENRTGSNFGTLRSGDLLERLSLVNLEVGGVAVEVLQLEEFVGLMAWEIQDGQVYADGADAITLSAGESRSLYLFGLTGEDELAIIDAYGLTSYPDTDVATLSSEGDGPVLTIRGLASGQTDFTVEYGPYVLTLQIVVP